MTSIPDVNPSIPNDIRASLVAPLGRLAGLDPFDLLARAIEVNEALLGAQADVASLRRKAVRELRSLGYTLNEIGTQLGTTAQRIHQIEAGYDRHEKLARTQPRPTRKL